MLLRSSSTPVLGSLLSSISESPNNNSTSHHHDHNSSVKHSSIFHHGHHSHNKLSFSHHALSCNPSPSLPRSGSIRRAQSEGNLEALASSGSSCNHHKDFETPKSSNHIQGRAKNGLVLLETIPSFTFYNSRAHYEEDEEESDGEDVGDVAEIRAINHGGEIDSERNKRDGNMVMDRNWNVGFDQETDSMSQSLFMARGIGFDGGFGGGRGGWEKSVGSGGDGGDNNQSVEEYYKRMVEENPCDALFLRNYARFLYQAKRDLHRAEEFYSRAILLDPNDGDTLSQYAKLVWELDGNEERASMYFQRAVQASPEDSHVHAAYASFLWDAEEDGDGCDAPQNLSFVALKLEGSMASASG